MKKAMENLLTLMLIGSLWNCGVKPEKKNIQGIRETKNTEKPSLAMISLNVKPIMEISTRSIPISDKNAFFNDVKKDSQGNLYFLDEHSICIYKFDPNGKYVKTFLRKGDGPGELSIVEGFKVIDDVIYCSNRLKYCCFDKDGNLLRNIQFKKQNIGVVEHVDLDHYITYQNIYDGNKSVGCRCLIIDVRNGEREIYKKMIPNIGYSVLKFPDKEFYYITGTTPKIQYHYNPNDKLIYCYYNYDYAVSLIDLNGKTKVIVSKLHSNIDLTNAELNIYAESFKRQGWSSMHVDMFKKNPSERSWPAIRNVRILANGYWGAIRPLSLSVKVMDVFNKEGEFQYIITKNDIIDDIETVSFFNKSIGVIKSNENSNCFIDYKLIDPLPFVN